MQAISYFWLALTIFLRFNIHFSSWSWVRRYQIVSILDFIGAKDDSTSDNCSYKICKATVKSSPPTNQHATFCLSYCPTTSARGLFLAIKVKTEKI